MGGSPTYIRICCITLLAPAALLLASFAPRPEWVGLVDARARSTAVPPPTERLFGGPLPGIMMPLDGTMQDFQPAAHCRCRPGPVYASRHGSRAAMRP